MGFPRAEAGWLSGWVAKDWAGSEGVTGVALRDLDVGKGGKAQSCGRETADDSDRFDGGTVFWFGISNGDRRPEEVEFWDNLRDALANRVAGCRSTGRKEAS